MPYLNHLEILLNTSDPTGKTGITGLGLSKRVPHNAIKAPKHHLKPPAILLPLPRVPAIAPENSKMPIYNKVIFSKKEIFSTKTLNNNYPTCMAIIFIP
jgi:hypothetical protein